MARLKPSTDIQPLSAFRANAAGFLKEVRDSRRPLVLTQHGKSAAVILDVEQYDALMEEIEVIREIKEARAQLARGEGIPHDEAIARLRARVTS
jgi:prevent-host-death family protein